MYKNHIRLTIAVFIFSALTACHTNTDKEKPDTGSVKILPVKIHRYEKALFAIPQDELSIGLESIVPEFGFFIGKNFQNQTSLLQMKNYLNDPGIIEAYQTSTKVFPDLGKTETELGTAFKFIKYYLPAWNQPEVYTYISGYDVENGTFITENNLVIPIDNYLGPDHKPYSKAGIPVYISQRLAPAYLIPDAIKSIVSVSFPEDPASRPLVEQMIIAGKILYFTQKVLPDIPDYLIIGYTPDQMQWCNENEENMWSFMIGQKLLYANNKNITGKFMSEAPFTAGLPRESPGRSGFYTGWQIIRSYMKMNSKVTLEQLMKDTDYQKIFNNSGYKPGKK
jgi:hypothetical protein